MQADTCPVLSVYCDKDNFGPLPAIQGVTRRLIQREVEIQQISSAKMGVRADHVSWAKHPAPAAAAIVDWTGKRG